MAERPKGDIRDALKCCCSLLKLESTSFSWPATSQGLTLHHFYVCRDVV